MAEETLPISRVSWDRFVAMLKNFVHSEVGDKAKKGLGLLVLFLFGINGLNVVNSYVGRDFFTAIENRNTGEFIWQAVLYIGVFAASTVVAVIYRFQEESLGLLWRNWLTGRAVNRYVDDNNFYRLDASAKVANPDERITEDIRSLTVTALSFVLMILNATFTIVAFSGVMWSISPLLFTVAVSYALGGSFLTILLGKPLVRLNYDQLDKEANFRADLIHLRENAEPVAMLHREGLLRARLLRHLDHLTTNFRSIIAVNRNLGFFTTGYNYLIQIIPALIIAPLFIRGEVEFGVIAQSAIAFAHLLGAFSLVVTQFQAISSFTAVIARLTALAESMEHKPAVAGERVLIENGVDGIVYEGLSLQSPLENRTLIKDLSIRIPPDMNALVIGASGTSRRALFRATAGIWDRGTGRIIRPEPDQIHFLTERPYIPPGTLCEVLSQDGCEIAGPDERVLSILNALGLDRVVSRAGGLHVECDWNDTLSLEEQQLLSVARLLLSNPKFVLLDRISTVLDRAQIDTILAMLRKQNITYVSLGYLNEENLKNYDSLLELRVDGSWDWKTIRDGEIIET
ncbi:MAG: ABC transporter ATP-binding protein/permease [Gammaproteobacteria bacterium]